MTTIYINAILCIPEQFPHRLRIQNHYRKSSGVLTATMTYSSLICSINFRIHFNSKT